MAIGDIEVTGTERKYTLNFGTNTACRIEEATGKSFLETLQDATSLRPKISILRQLVKAALVSHPEATLDEVGDIIDDLGGSGSVLAGLRTSALPMVEDAPATASSDTPVDTKGARGRSRR